MTPKAQSKSDLELFRSRLSNIIDMAHPLVLLAQRIDWDALGGSFGKFFCEKRRPAQPTRLLVGLHLVKHMEGLSGKAVCAAWVQNPYHQYFCANVFGSQFFERRLVLDRLSMTRQREFVAQAGRCGLRWQAVRRPQRRSGG